MGAKTYEEQIIFFCDILTREITNLNFTHREAYQILDETTKK